MISWLIASSMCLNDVIYDFLEETVIGLVCESGSYLIGSV